MRCALPAGSSPGETRFSLPRSSHGMTPSCAICAGARLTANGTVRTSTLKSRPSLLEMTEEEKYSAFLSGLQLRWFSPREVMNYAKSTRNGVPNSLPPEDLWTNLPPTLWVIDSLRESVGLPIRLTSIYRSPAYNKAVGGSSGSFHMKNAAIDFQVDGMGPQQAFNALNKMRHAGSWHGGLGAYETFTHCDAGLRLSNATW